MKKLICAFFCISVATLPCKSLARAGDVTFSATVVGISDGDTFTALVNNETFRVRLAEIDAPETKQAFGNRAKQALSALIFGKSVQLKVRGRDRNGRRIAWVKSESVVVNSEMVKQGFAWVYRRYAPKNSPLYEIEREAVAAKRGLWVESAPVPPWEWRSRARAGGRSSGNQ